MKQKIYIILIAVFLPCLAQAPILLIVKGDIDMKVKYDRLWNTLRERNMFKTDLICEAKIGTYAMARNVKALYCYPYIEAENTTKHFEREETSMRTMIYCKPTKQGVHSFYLVSEGREYYLFSQNYRKSVQAYFSRGVTLDTSMNYAKSHNDSAIMKTMSKLPLYIKYIEKEYEIEVYEKTKRRNRQTDFNHKKCA